MTRAGRKSDASGMKEGRRSGRIGSSAQPRAGSPEAHGAADRRDPAKHADDNDAVPSPRVGFEQRNHKGTRKNKMPPSRRRLIPLQVVVVEGDEERQGPASSSSSMDEDFLAKETTRRSTTTMPEDERRGRCSKVDAVEGELEEVEVMSDGKRTVLVERGRRPTSVVVVRDIPPELPKYMGASSVHDVIHSLQSAVRSMRSLEDDPELQVQALEGPQTDEVGGGGVEVSEAIPHAVLNELLVPEAALTKYREIKTYPAVQEQRPRGRQRHRQLPHEKRGARRWPFGSRRPSEKHGKKAGESVASKPPPAVQPLIAGATVAVVPLQEGNEKSDVPRRVRAAWEAAGRAATIKGQRGTVVKILPFVERPKQHNVPSRRLSYELPSLLSSSIHESLSEGICDDHDDDDEAPVPPVETNKNDTGLMCVATGAKCYAEDPVASEGEVLPGGGFAKLRCGGAGSGSDDDASTTTATESDDSGMSSNRPRVVSFETNHHTTNESVVSIIGTASTVTTTQDAEEGSARELESDTTATFLSSSYSSSAFKEPAAAGVSIVEMVRAASCRQASDASSSGNCHDGFESDQETDFSSDSSSSECSSCRSVARRSQRRPAPPREEVATLDEALQSGRRWLW
jgi:hypothetical protein